MVFSHLDAGSPFFKWFSFFSHLSHEPKLHDVIFLIVFTYYFQTIMWAYITYYINSSHFFPYCSLTVGECTYSLPCSIFLSKSGQMCCRFLWHHEQHFFWIFTFGCFCNCTFFLFTSFILYLFRYLNSYRKILQMKKMQLSYDLANMIA